MLDLLPPPPRCSGPAVKDWDWTGLQSQSKDSTTWGTFQVVGHWGGASLTLTQPPNAPIVPNTASPDEDFSSPCAPPAGGWHPLDPATTTDSALNRAVRDALQQPDYAGSWMTQLDDPLPSPPAGMNQPARLVLNLRYTKDIALHEHEVRAVYGGALCVSTGPRTITRLRAIQGSVTSELGPSEVQSSSIDEGQGVVTTTVWVATQSRQRQLDDKYGVGVVDLQGLLHPID